MAWQTPKTNWSAADGVRDTDMNRIEGNILHLYTTDAVRSALVVYVSTTGNDTTGAGTPAAPYKTITKALSVIPKNLNGMSVSINIAAGTYEESVDISHFYGGTISLTGASNAAVTILNLTMLNCVCTVSNIALTVSSTGATGIIIGNGASVIFEVSVTVHAVLNGILCHSGGVLVAQQSVIANSSGIAVRAETQGRVHIGTLAGTGSTQLFAADSGGHISYGTYTHTGHSATFSTFNGGRIYTGAQTSPAIY